MMAKKGILIKIICLSSIIFISPDSLCSMEKEKKELIRKAPFECVPFFMIGDSKNNFFTSVCAPQPNSEKSYSSQKHMSYSSQEPMDMGWVIDLLNRIPQKAREENINTLRLNNARFDMNVGTAINAFPQLESLFLDDTYALSLNFEHLKCCELTSLSAVGCNIKSIKGIEKLSKLIHLDLSYNNIVDIAPLNENRCLKLLVLAHNKINDLTPLVEKNTLLLQLEGLAVQGNPLEKEKLEVAIRSCKNLEAPTETAKTFIMSLFKIRKKNTKKLLKEATENLQLLEQKKESNEKEIILLRQKHDKLDYFYLDLCF